MFKAGKSCLSKSTEAYIAWNEANFAFWGFIYNFLFIRGAV
jgi:hypothetical protein